MRGRLTRELLRKYCFPPPVPMMPSSAAAEVRGGEPGATDALVDIAASGKPGAAGALVDIAASGKPGAAGALVDIAAGGKPGAAGALVDIAAGGEPGAAGALVDIAAGGGAGDAAAAASDEYHVEDSRIFICGPAAMNDSICTMLEEMKYPSSVVVVLNSFARM